MPELGRERDQIWITRSHLMALGVATGCIALLSFFLGMKVGRSSASPGEEVRPPGLVADAARQEELEAVLREAARASPKQDLAFPGELPSDSVGAPPAEASEAGAEQATSVAPPPGQALPAAEAPVGDVPHGGWSVQVGTFASAAEADNRMAELKTGGLRAYRVATLVDGQNVWRLRLGGYKTQDEANGALPELRSRLGVSDLTVAPAP